MNISWNYYNTLRRNAKSLRAYNEKVYADRELFKIAKKTFPRMVHGDKPESLLPIMYLDLLRIYKKFDYSTDIHTKEGLGLLLLMSDADLKLDWLDIAISTVESSYNNIIEPIKELLPKIPEDNDLLYNSIIESSQDPFIARQYSHYLFWYFLTIAKCDHVVDSTESKMLLELLERKNKAAGVTYDGDLFEKLCSIIDKSLKPDEDIKIIDQTKKDSAADFFNDEIRKMSDELIDTESNEDPANSEASKPKEEEVSGLDELDGLIGLHAVKEEIHSLVNFVRVTKMRQRSGLRTTPLSLHCVFSGNPGTGKTTVARILARIYKEIGLSQTGQLIEVDRSGLVAEYVGQTAVKTNKVIDSAIGGVLFIDEAYTLAPTSKEDFGGEAIATLLKRMEDDRDKLIVILAGYTDEMDHFIRSNPGLESRFSRHIFFEDYDAADMLAIFKYQMEKFDYILSNDAETALIAKIDATLENKPRDFGNARFIRNLFEKVVQMQANRIACLPEVDELILSSIEVEDIPV